MTIISQGEYSAQMVAQLRLLNPSISAEVGTPERLIIDTVAQALSDSSVDLIGLEEALNVDSKFGSNLDNFVALFGFARQEATNASGFVKFSRNTASASNIYVPRGTLLQSSTRQGEDGPYPQYRTTATAELEAGKLETELVPVIATSPGELSNMPAGVITNLTVGEPVVGVTAVTNPAPITGGSNAENDNSLKVRFKNTVFRNVAGTESQYLAAALSMAYSTKANVIGPISKYQEYLQVPPSPDSKRELYGVPGSKTEYPGLPSLFVGIGTIETGTGIVTVASTAGIVNSVKVYAFHATGTEHPVEVITGVMCKVESGSITATTFKIEGEIPSSTLKNVVIFVGTIPSTPLHTYTTALSSIPYAKYIWKTTPIFASDSEGVIDYFYREGVDFTFNYPAVFQGDTLRDYIDGSGGTDLDPRIEESLASTQPNVTFTNVYEGTNQTFKAVSPGDTVLIEYAYTSTSSRNSPLHNVTNAVDVYVDGSNEQPASTIFAPPLSISSSTNTFTKTEPNNLFYFENYRRDGLPTKRPLAENPVTPLYNQPVTSLPAQIKVGTTNFYLGEHYWLVHETDQYQGTIRARDGIEWSLTRKGDNGAHSNKEYEGKTFKELAEEAVQPAIEVNNYTFDQNITDLQASLESVRQITTDVLAHKARTRYFKLDITVVYSPQLSQTLINNKIQQAVSEYLSNQYFGTIVRLSDLLQVIHNVNGVENVRWSNDLEHNESLVRVYETDVNGYPLLGVSADRNVWGRSGTTKAQEVQSIYLAGAPLAGVVKFEHGTNKYEINLNEGGVIGTTSIKAAYAALYGISVSVSKDTRLSTYVTQPIESWLVTFPTEEEQELPIIKNEFTKGGEYVFDVDFYLKDDELPALPTGEQSTDTVPGLIIRSRAQNVWQRS